MNTFKYIHARKSQHFGQWLRGKGMGVSKRQKGGFTVCYAYAKVADDEQYKVDYTIAQCSDKDCFNKKRGRALSRDRLTLGNNYRTLTLRYDGTNSFYSWLNDEVFQDALNHLPGRA